MLIFVVVVCGFRDFSLAWEKFRKYLMVTTVLKRVKNSGKIYRVSDINSTEVNRIFMNMSF